jgi:hypothetical protein
MNDYQKLIDWELRRQLSLVVLVLTFLSVAMALLGNGLVKSKGFLYLEVATPKICMNVTFSLVYGLMAVGLDIVFYRLTSSLARMREYESRLPEEMTKWVQDRNPLNPLIGWFLKVKTDKKPNAFSLRKERVWLLIILGDVVLLFAFLSVISGGA